MNRGRPRSGLQEREAVCRSMRGPDAGMVQSRRHLGPLRSRSARSTMCSADAGGAMTTALPWRRASRTLVRALPLALRPTVLSAVVVSTTVIARIKARSVKSSFLSSYTETPRFFQFLFFPRRSLAPRDI
ncbi:hypothetical protein HPB50_000393 [Hyalomma asiaticum]|uniref:Uncharacterized protein n=1 Tax=Hyalomma asiaticum TaxID=266040 RepID=A0ACB7SAQ9_HYAAI|nr:hypothetical protein HPB50_000393 [Hyalomma asiaticum]